MCSSWGRFCAAVLCTGGLCAFLPHTPDALFIFDCLGMSLFTSTSLTYTQNLSCHYQGIFCHQYRPLTHRDLLSLFWSLFLYLYVTQVLKIFCWVLAQILTHKPLKCDSTATPIFFFVCVLDYPNCTHFHWFNLMLAVLRIFFS